MKKQLTFLALVLSTVHTLAAEPVELRPMGLTILTSGGGYSLYFSCLEKTIDGCSKIVAVSKQNSLDKRSEISNYENYENDDKAKRLAVVNSENLENTTNKLQDVMNHDNQIINENIPVMPGQAFERITIGTAMELGLDNLSENIQMVVKVPFVIAAHIINVVVSPVSFSGKIIHSKLHKKNAKKLIEAMLNPKYIGQQKVEDNFVNLQNLIIETSVK